MKNACIAAALLLLASQAYAVNRCIGPDGRVSFQDAPCAGKGEAVVVKPATGAAPAAAGGGANDAQRINAEIDRSAAARRVVEFDAYLIPRAMGALEAHVRKCAQERKAIEGSQYAYVQNLYGKTHAAQKASELVQHTLDCDRKAKELQDQIRTLEAERDRHQASTGPAKDKP